jgi:hypothetical protein
MSAQRPCVVFGKDVDLPMPQAEQNNSKLTSSTDQANVEALSESHERPRRRFALLLR